MTNWPDKPLIRVLDGEVNEDGVADELAYHVGDGAYALISEEHMDQTIVRNAYGDMIVKWEEVAAVPAAALKRLQDAFRGIDVIESLEPPLLEVLSYLPADKPGPLDQAVTMVRELKDGAIYPADFDSEKYLALLLGALATLQGAIHKAQTLATIARICVEWVTFLAPVGFDALSEIKERAESDPDQGGFIAMASLAGDVAAGIEDGMSGGPMKHLLTIAQYALAWAAQIIEEDQ